MSFSILTVCTGNICRSPLAEQLLRAGLAPWPGIAVASAGTASLAGHPMPEQAQNLSREFGGAHPELHTARDLAPTHLREAGLVLGLAREHRRDAVQMLPKALRRAFTLREFARLSEGITDTDLAAAAALELSDHSGRLAVLVEVARSRRGMVLPPAHPDDDDVIDPFRRSDAVYRASADQLVPAVKVIVAQFARALAVTNAAPDRQMLD